MCFFSHNMFDRYRNLDANEKQANSFADCARVFNDCKEAEKYNENHDDDNMNEDKEEQEAEDNVDDEEDTNTTESDAANGSDATETSQTNDIAENEARAHTRSVGRFILRRADKRRAPAI